MSHDEWVRIDASWLPQGWERRADLVAEFHSDGQLKRLARVKGDAWLHELTLEHGVRRGRQTDRDGSGGTSDWTTHDDGFSENFDAWSDNSKPWRDPFAEFVRRSIARVVGGAPSR